MILVLFGVALSCLFLASCENKCATAHDVYTAGSCCEEGNTACESAWETVSHNFLIAIAENVEDSEVDCAGEVEETAQAILDFDCANLPRSDEAEESEAEEETEEGEPAEEETIEEEPAEEEPAEEEPVEEGSGEPSEAE